MVSRGTKPYTRGMTWLSVIGTVVFHNRRLFFLMLILSSWVFKAQVNVRRPSQPQHPDKKSDSCKNISRQMFLWANMAKANCDCSCQSVWCLFLLNFNVLPRKKWGRTQLKSKRRENWRERKIYWQPEWHSLFVPTVSIPRNTKKIYIWNTLLIQYESKQK